MNEIESESKFIWKFILDIILLPIYLIMVLMRKKRIDELFKPFKDLISYIFQPKFTITIIIINVVMFFISFSFSENLFNSLVNYPFDFLSVHFYTLFTSGFLHGDFSHLFWNMVGIFIFGRVVEKKYGASKTSLIYFGALMISSLGWSIMGLITNNMGSSLGASGALMGLVAAAILIDPFYITYELLMPLPIMIVGWITILADISGILGGNNDGVAYFAHIFGYLSVMISLYLLGSEERSDMKKGIIINIISLIVIAIILYLGIDTIFYSFFSGFF